MAARRVGASKSRPSDSTSHRTRVGTCLQCAQNAIADPAVSDDAVCARITACTSGCPVTIASKRARLPAARHAARVRPAYAPELGA